MNIAALLANAARTFGERPAISVGDELRLTYAQLHRRIVRLAGALSARPELVPGDRVALVMANRPQYIELLQAIWHAGLCAVPINARLHPREIEFILGNCAVKLCFVTEDVAESVAPLRAGLPALAGVISVDDPDYERLLQAEPVPQYAADGADLAWIYYTSGTTGRPKGAMLSHRNLLMMAMSYLCDVDLLTPEESFFYLGPLSHGAGLLGLSHLAKATHQVLPASGGFDPGELVDLINRHRHATFFLAQTMLRRFLDAPNIASAIQSADLQLVMQDAERVDRGGFGAEHERTE